MSTLRNVFRFSLLELLWMCGVLAVFLGLNLRMSEFIQAQGVDDRRGMPTLEYYYCSTAGWPHPYLDYESSAHTHAFPKANVDWTNQRKLDFELDMKDLPGFIPGTHRPSFEYAWEHTREFKTLELARNILTALSIALFPMLFLKFFKKRRTPEKLSSSVTPI